MIATRFTAGFDSGDPEPGTAMAATLDVAIDIVARRARPASHHRLQLGVIVADNVYEGLTALDPDQPSTRPRHSRGTSPTTALTYTFHLRDGVTFHDGSDFDAEDVAASLRRVQSEEHRLAAGQPHLAGQGHRGGRSADQSS